MGREFSISLSDKRFNQYLHELIEWNKKFNLTSITDPKEIKIRHFEDSLSILSAIDLDDESIVDVGAGAGFPGIPLKIMRPNLKLTLVEGTRKKVEFLKHIIKTLNLTDAEAIWGRAEEINKKNEYRGKYDVVVSRAVAKISELSGYCLPFLRAGGLFVAMKQDKVENEVSGAEKDIQKFGGKFKEIKKVEVGEIKRSLVVIVKSG